MADAGRPALGLSVGATNLAAVTADRAITRKPVLTLYRQRPPEVGVPEQNPKIDEPGLVIGDFVDQVGLSTGIAAADGTTHRSETLVADALRALAYTATDGGTLPESVAVTHPAHWTPAAVDALRVALHRVSEWSRGRPVLLSDSAAALFALQANPGVPSHGIVAVCDVGGSGTTVTLVDAANGDTPIAAMRTAEFCGDRIDEALLTHVVADLASAGSFDTAATSAIGSLSRLRAACRGAKERLSSTTETALTAEVPGYQGEIHLTRDELDDAIREPLHGFTSFVHDVLRGSGVRPDDLAAIASVGGGASIPLVAATLSEQFGALIITAPRPHLTAAMGAALRAAHGVDDGETTFAPTTAGSMADLTARSEVIPESQAAPALAWSQADDASGLMPIEPVDSPSSPSVLAEVWYRRPLVVAAGTALAVLAVGGGLLVAIRHTSSDTPNAPTSSVSPTPANPGYLHTRTRESTTQPTETETATSSPVPTTSSQAPTTTTDTTTATTTTSAAPTTTQDPQRPDRPRLFPRDGAGPRIFPPGPGYR